MCEMRLIHVEIDVWKRYIYMKRDLHEIDLNKWPGDSPNHTATHCTTRQHTTPHGNTLHHTVTHCTTRQHTATHCTTLHHTAPHCATLHHTATHTSDLVTPYITPQHLHHVLWPRRTQSKHQMPHGPRRARKTNRPARTRIRRGPNVRHRCVCSVSSLGIYTRLFWFIYTSLLTCIPNARHSVFMIYCLLVCT